MGKHSAPPKHNPAGGALLAAAAAGAAAAALGSAGTANSTCASINGIGNGNGCSSTPTSFAIGIGDNTRAQATGQFTGAIAVGLTNGASDQTRAIAVGDGDLVFASGKNTLAQTAGDQNFVFVSGKGALAQSFGNRNAAFAIGDKTFATAGANPDDTDNFALSVSLGTTTNKSEAWAGSTEFDGPPSSGNIAINFGTDSKAYAVSRTIGGGHNFAFNIGDRNSVSAAGLRNSAINLLGNDNTVSVIAGDEDNAAPGLSQAFNFGGSNNFIEALKGPYAIAGAIGVSGYNGNKSIAQSGTGTNIKTPLNP